MFDDEQPTLESLTLPPDASIAKAIGGHHSLDSAIADLVDNSIDANAHRIRVRFIESETGVQAIRVVDDGYGMSRAALIDAMTIGKRNVDGKDGRLGHFGMGLKAASLSQAERFTVWSRSVREEPVSAVRLRREDYSATGLVEIVDAAADEADGDLAGGLVGTVVQWTELRSTSRSPNRRARTMWLSQVIDGLCQSLGVIFHRIIDEDSLEIVVDLFDSELGRAGAPRLIEPIDPFGFRVSGDPLFPMSMRTRSVSPEPSVSIEAHILPPKTESSSARLFGRPRTESQGFYVYRYRRLLQAGGWNTVRTNRADLQLARVRIDVTDDMAHLVRINAEKRGVELLPAFAASIEGAISSDGSVGFADYLATAQRVFKISQARRRDLAPVAPLGKGFHPRLKRQLGKTFPVDQTREPVNIRWRKLGNDAFFEVDLHGSTIWLNEKYRKRLTGHDRGGINDAPIIKTALFLMLQQFMSKQWLQSTTIEQLDAWQESLNLAADVELDIWEDGD